MSAAASGMGGAAARPKTMPLLGAARVCAARARGARSHGVTENGYRSLRIVSSELSRAFAEKNDANRLEQHRNVEQERMILHVVDVVLEFFNRLFERRSVAGAHLRPAGDSRAHAVPHRVKRDCLGELRDEARALRSRSHQAHLAFKDID